jgi:hypothetical protein
MNKSYWRETADGWVLVQDRTPEESAKWSIEKAMFVGCLAGLLMWIVIIYGVVWEMR